MKSNPKALDRAQATSVYTVIVEGTIAAAIMAAMVVIAMF